MQLSRPRSRRSSPSSRCARCGYSIPRYSNPAAAPVAAGCAMPLRNSLHRGKHAIGQNSEGLVTERRIVVGAGEHDDQIERRNHEDEIAAVAGREEAVDVAAGTREAALPPQEAIAIRAQRIESLLRELHPGLGNHARAVPGSAIEIELAEFGGVPRLEPQAAAASGGAVR